MSVKNLSIAKAADLVTKNDLCNNSRKMHYIRSSYYSNVKVAYLRGFLFYKSIKFYYNISCTEQ
ncbi:TPA: hypothetical protein QFJ23_000354 [Staphylococcus aureus]|nr:hypothetical protein [Staphylococcus aureus]HDT6897920.1 hypothetical protein [Staphylococcus aureus]HDT6905352.1 hypothetical protein [Staphylococcus aureus]